MTRVLSGVEWLGVGRGVLVKYMRHYYVETGCKCIYESFVSIPYLPSLCPQSTTLQLQVDSCETSAKPSSRSLLYRTLGFGLLRKGEKTTTLDRHDPPRSVFPA